MKIIKNDAKPVQNIRFAIQAVFALLCLWIGYEFYFFIQWLETSGMEGSFARPPGVEGFLPISSLMSVYYFIQTGEIHSVHPAGFFIFLAILSVSVVFGKSFCSWMCPIGLLSEAIADFSERLQLRFFKKIFRIPKVLDIPLRSLKYLLLAFFVYSIFLMSLPALASFLNSPYNVMADVKMWYFFEDISLFSLTVIAILFVFSFLYRNFWCRYLCPYGALLGIASLLSPYKIKREPASCTDCGLCTKSCPSRIKVDKVTTVISDECSTCLQCVDACPVKDTLQLKNVITGKAVNKRRVVLGLLAIYLGITGIGVLTGHWQNSVTKEQYLRYQEKLNSIGHVTSTEEIKKLNNRYNKQK